MADPTGAGTTASAPSTPRLSGNDLPLAALLRAKDQALLVAVHNGGRALWADTITPDFFYMEEGEIQPRDAFLAGLVPDGGRGLVIRDLRVDRYGDTALVLHHDAAPADPDDPRASQPQLYVMTETWTLVGGEWKLHLVHVDAQKTAPPAVALTTGQLDELVGTYQRGSSLYQVKRLGDRLAIGRPGKADIILRAETRDVFFDPDELRARYIFGRDGQGRATTLIRRDENSDDVWRREDAAGMGGMTMSSAGATPPSGRNSAPSAMAGMGDMNDGGARQPMAAMDGGTATAMAGTAMQGMLGRYPMARESSGTSWQPDSSPARGYMTQAGGWSVMAEGYITGIYDDQGGRRGDRDAFSESMGMVMGSRNVSAVDRIGLRAMLSLDPAMGPSGYPLLLAVGETANGRTPLVDRQHPHDLFMELAGSWAHDLGGDTELSLYAGLPGEPALGPPTFMHRVSGMDNPEAPIGHHWFDSTHITYGVVTAGLSSGRFKLEASAFRGREPDQHRWDIERPSLDSWSVRAWWNPTADLSIQLSTGHLHSPEQLDPGQNEQRTTASVTWNKPIGDRATWATTIAWSNKDEQPGPALTGLLAESALTIGRNEVYGRAEHEQENELFDLAAGRVFPVSKLSLGYQHEIAVARHLFVAIGGLASAYQLPDAVKASYGGDGVKSFMLYGRLRFGA